MVQYHIRCRPRRLVVDIIIRRIIAGHDDGERPRLVAAILVATAGINILQRMGKHQFYLLHIGVCEIGPHGIRINSKAIQVGIILLVVHAVEVAEKHLVSRVNRYKGGITIRHLWRGRFERRFGTVVIAMACGEYHCGCGNKQTDLFHW